MPKFPLGRIVENIVEWIMDVFGYYLDVFSDSVDVFIDKFHGLLAYLPWWLIILIFALLAFRASGWEIGVRCNLRTLLYL